ncbi:Ribulose-phosphate 3-epimerase [Candidatus Magnetaquicoccaceae bacterium FCR-1]|uniref:Ribulose-phosphate 3-epimerase n=1 Tax=Candidatus Magnetaquiglobus chichijimensis TaxID=3141448 RepID=A0ABQ0CCB9_9PROT
MIKIAPSVLSADFARLGEEVRAVEQAGADYIHVDVMDGHFVPNLTIGPLVVQAIARVATKPLDVHLMISPVEVYIPDFVKAGASILTVHAEATHHLDRTLNVIRELGCKVGLALNPATPLCNLGNVLSLLDMVVIMSVNPGFGGQSFIPYALQRIQTVRRMINDRGLRVELEVDGGIKPENIQAAVKAGADVFVAGSAIFSKPDYGAVIRAMRENAAA